MSANPRHLTYRTEGTQEACLSFGRAGAERRLLIVPPLFEEMNRTRAMLVTAMRGLAARDVMTLLPDLPGCNESVAMMEQQAIGSWRKAIEACAKEHGATHVASIRGGALIDDGPFLRHWRLAPVKGASLLKTMLRTRMVADKENGKSSTAESLITEAEATGWVELAGYRLGTAMLLDLDGAVASPVNSLREVQLGEAPGQLWGKPIWLRTEPQEDPDMSMALAAELDSWSAA